MAKVKKCSSMKFLCSFLLLTVVTLTVPIIKLATLAKNELELVSITNLQTFEQDPLSSLKGADTAESHQSSSATFHSQRKLYHLIETTKYSTDVDTPKTFAEKSHAAERSAQAAVANKKEKKQCGTPDFGSHVMKRVVELAAKKRRDGKNAQRPTSIVIDTYFHIIVDQFGTGDVDNSVIVDQINFLNRAFNASGSIIQFRGVLVKRLLFRNVQFASLYDYEDQLGQFREGALNALNVFVLPDASFYGRANPWFYTGLVELDSIYVINTVLPGGGEPAHDSGVTMVHEVGHWLGLIHVFQAIDEFVSYPCSPQNPNDHIADTNQMRDSTPTGIGCGRQRDTCPNRPGLDPTNNYMDYGDSYDSTTLVPCKTMFTKQQVARMEDIWWYYRINHEICASNEFLFTVQFRFDSYPYEISWNITFANNGTLVHDSIPDGLGDTYNYGLSFKTLTTDVCLVKQQYIFHLYDQAGDGIIAPGFYKLSVDGVQIARGGQSRYYSKQFPFGPGNSTTTVTPKPVTTRKPTRKPSRKPTRKPTRKPSRKPTSS